MAPQRRSQRLVGGGAGSAAAAAAASSAQPPGGAAGQAGMGDSGDAVMARWLQSAGLQHLATSSAGGGDYRGGMAGLGGAGAGSMLPNLLMQVRFISASLSLSGEKKMRDLVVGMRIAKVASLMRLPLGTVCFESGCCPDEALKSRVCCFAWS